MRTVRVTLPWVVVSVVLLAMAGVLFALRWRLTERDALQPVVLAANERGVALVGSLAGIRNGSPQQRGGGDEQSLHLRAVVLQLLDRDRTRGDVDPHAAGVARLLHGDLDESVTLLSKAAAGEAPADPWNDLAAALLERGARDANPEDFARALGAADHALRLDPALTEAASNRAIALQRLGLGTPRDGSEGTTAERWKRILPRLESAAAAHDQATVRQIVHEFPQQARTWAEVEFLNSWAGATRQGRREEAAERLELARAIGDALVALSGERLLHDAVDAATTASARGEALPLAAAHEAYREGRVLVTRRRVAEASPRFDEALHGFTAAHSPMALVDDYYRANVLYDSNRPEEALALVRSLLQRAPVEDQALRAQLQWTEGTILLNEGDPRAALSSYRAALGAFEKLGERDNASSLRDLSAGALSLLGRRRESWVLRRDAFAEALQSGDSAQLQLELTVAARIAIRERQWDEAWSLVTRSLQLMSGNARLRADALLWRALALWRNGESSSSDLDAAAAAVRAIPDPLIRASAEADLHLVEGATLVRSEPARAIDRLLMTISFANRSHKTTVLPSALLQRAEAYRRLADPDRADSDLQQAATIMERRRGSINEADLRETVLGTARGIYEQLTDLRLERGDAAGAFEAAERMRSRRILEEIAGPGAPQIAEPMTTSAMVAAVPTGVVIASYLVVGDHLTIMTLSRSGARVAASKVDAAEIGQLRARLRRAIRNEDLVQSQAAAAPLYEALVAPLQPELSSARMLVVVPDDLTSAVPFAALYDRSASQFLIERLPVVMAPSATTYLQSLHAAVPPRRAVERALVVGAPSIDRKSYPDLQPLPSSASEAATVAAMYGTRPILGDQATVTRVAEELLDADIVHLATHAVADRSAALSAVILAPDASSPGALHARELAAMHLARRPIVVLAACATSEAGESEDGIRSLALAFLAAGSRTVVGTLWEIDDDAAARMTIDLHRALRAGVPAAEALRESQRKAMTHGNSPGRSLRTWSAFQVYGAGF